MTSVIFDGNDNDVGKIIKVKINKSNQSTLFGKKITKFRTKGINLSSSAKKRYSVVT